MMHRERVSWVQRNKKADDGEEWTRNSPPICGLITIEIRERESEGKIILVCKTWRVYGLRRIILFSNNRQIGEILFTGSLKIGDGRNTWKRVSAWNIWMLDTANLSHAYCNTKHSKHNIIAVNISTRWRTRGGRNDEGIYPHGLFLVYKHKCVLKNDLWPPVANITSSL